MSKFTLGRAWAALFVALCAVTAARPLTEADVFWHLSLGRDVLRYRARVVPDPTILPGFSALCTAQEWLWDLFTYGVYHLQGWTGLALLVVALAGTAAWAVLQMLVPRDRRDEPDTVGAVALVSSLVMWAALTRIRERPEAAAMVLLPVFVTLAQRYVHASDLRARRKTAIWLVVVEIIWAQVHPSFVLSMGVFVLLVGVDFFIRRDPDRARTDGITALALALGLTSSAFGLRFVHNLFAHTHGDAVRHIDDMAAPTWAMFNPLHLSPWLAFPALVLVGVLGMAASRKIPWAELLLALLGAALTMTARRGIGPGAVLAGPFAMDGALALTALFPARHALALALVGITTGGALLTRTVVHNPPGVDPPGRLGLRPGWYPERAALILRSAPAGTRVLTSYTSGPPLAFWLGGHVRTYVDSRTPMFFDDADYAVAREIWGNAEALARGVHLYDFTVASVERDGRTCELLAVSPAWYPAVVEAHTSLFVRRGHGWDPPPVTALSPCGLDYLRPTSCGTDTGAAIIADLRRLDPTAESPFARYLLAERLLRCRPPGSSPMDAFALLPSADDSVAFAMQRYTLEATLDVALGRTDAALSLITRMLADGDLAAPRIVLPTLLARHAWRDVRTVLEPVSLARGDLASPEVEGTLAVACAADGNVRGARFHGLRAASLGDPSAIPALCWLIRQPEVSSAQRDDARGWIATLASEHPNDPRFVCHHAP